LQQFNAACATFAIYEFVNVEETLLVCANSMCLFLVLGLCVSDDQSAIFSSLYVNILAVVDGTLCWRSHIGFRCCSRRDVLDFISHFYVFRTFSSDVQSSQCVGAERCDACLLNSVYLMPRCCGLVLLCCDRYTMVVLAKCASYFSCICFFLLSA